MALFTVGHGGLGHDELTTLLTGAGITGVVDVRRFPGSRRNPGVNREELAAALPQAGIAYRWAEGLGGRRSLSAAEDEHAPDTWWQVKAFRAYAGYARTEPFRTALDHLAHQAVEQAVAVMCAEAVWWRCHRRIIADVATLTHDLPVEHLMHDGRHHTHEPSPGARVRDGVVVWDGTG